MARSICAEVATDGGGSPRFGICCHGERTVSLGSALGSITALLLGIFVGIVVWIYGFKRERDFESAARMPLDEQESQS
ncbi:MAG: cbb3-type cytochrome c oxidase subunit 3 [Xanthomonadales bacterium PRO6]|nr:cbb3-type cytochrome c oxidase subunit 3 [Xanthomonadales bacterium PRO6]